MRRFLHKELVLSLITIPLLSGCSKGSSIPLEPEQIIKNQVEQVPARVFEPVIIVTEEDIEDISGNQEELLMDAAQYSELDKLLRQITEMTN